jgi:hypothetical protein
MITLVATLAMATIPAARKWTRLLVQNVIKYGVSSKTGEKEEVQV